MQIYANVFKTICAANQSPSGKNPPVGELKEKKKKFRNIPEWREKDNLTNS